MLVAQRGSNSNDQTPPFWTATAGDREGLMDAMVHNNCSRLPRSEEKGRMRNSVAGSSMWSNQRCTGPKKSPLRMKIFTRVEDSRWGCPANTVKLRHQWMKERPHNRQPCECIAQAKVPACFINNRFFPRPHGDEIPTSMEAGPKVPKGEMKNAPWISAYEGSATSISVWPAPAGAARNRQGDVGHALSDGSHAGRQDRIQSRSKTALGVAIRLRLRRCTRMHYHTVMFWRVRTRSKRGGVARGTLKTC